MLRNPCKNLWLASGVLVLIVVALLVILVVPNESNSGITYKGKPLEYWFSQAPILLVSTNGSTAMVMSIPTGTNGEQYGCYLEKDDDVKRAFWAMGTNCLPFLVKKLGGHASRISFFIVCLAYRLKIKPGLSLLIKDCERGQAIVALNWLDPLPKETYEQIRALSKSKNPEVAVAAKEALSECHEMPPGIEPVKIHEPAKLR